jgi:hypothetical protein
MSLVMSGLKATGIKRLPIVVVEIPIRQPLDRNKHNVYDDESSINDTDDDAVDDDDDEDYFYHADDSEEEGEKIVGGGDGNSEGIGRIGGSGGARESGGIVGRVKRSGRADWDQEEQEGQEDQDDEEDQEQDRNSTPLSQIPDFKVLGRRGIREAKVQLDHVKDNSFVDIFTQFFDKAMLETIIENTNAYALSKGAGQGRPWTDLVMKELLVFLAILIYLGLYPVNKIEELWNDEILWPVNFIASKMSLMRFQQIKRFLHISKPQDNILQGHNPQANNPQVNNYPANNSQASNSQANNSQANNSQANNSQANNSQANNSQANNSQASNSQAKKDPYYTKVEPLLSHIRDISKKLYIPSSNVSVDEMMVRFSGRSNHTIRIRGKPTPEGYKIFALCDHGYTYTFLPSSRVHKNEEVSIVDGITYTGSVVLHLALQLPYKRKPFNIFMDNYFSSISLFAWLRRNNIGACGTVRAASRGFPKELKVPKRAKLEWNYQTGRVVGEDEDVLAALWMDNGPVTMLTTIHGLGKDWQVSKNRRRPRQTGLNAGHVGEVFGDEGQRILGIPCMIDDYNHHMGGVDTADQLRSYNSTQLRARRNWLPLFFWLLDISLVNSFILAKLMGQAKSPVEFRKKLLWELIDMAEIKEAAILTQDPVQAQAQAQALLPKTRVTKKSTADDLPATRLKNVYHPPHYNSQRRTCIWCSFKLKSNEGGKRLDALKTQFSCTLCNVYLCMNSDRNCFNDFHTLDS